MPPTSPTLVKTWQYATNLNPGLNGSDFIDCAKMMILIKNALIGFGSNAWTVIGSSDSSTAGIDAVDRLTDYTKIVTGGGAHSWIVLQQAQMNANTQILIDFGQALGSNGYINLYWSPSVGFSGGSTSSRPTASDEQAPWQGAAIQFFNGWSFTGNGMGMRAHVMQSTDGQCTRIFFAQAHIVRTWLQFDKPSSPVPGWTNPVIAIMNTANTNPAFFGGNSMFQQFIQAVGPVTVMPMHPCFMGDSTNGNVMGYTWTLTDQFSGQFPLYTIGMYHITTAGQKGRHGSLTDMWIAPSLALPGTSFPSDGSKQFILMGSLAHPWNGGDIEMG